MISTSYGHCWITFKNGYSVSIFNGFGSYSENHFNHKLFEKMQDLDFQDQCDSEDCEIAIFHQELGFVTRNFIENCNDSVIGYITPDEIPDIMKKVKEAENIEL